MPRSLFLVSVLLLGLLVRLLFLGAGGVTIDSDEAIVGLMAKHIAEGREWPIFYYGQPYMGSLEPSLVAQVFRFSEMNAWTLKSVPLFFSVLFIYLVFLLGEKFGGDRVARKASLLAAIPPVGFVEWGTKARGGFIELVFLGTLSLLLAVSLIRRERPSRSSFGWIGVILGLAWWTNNQAIFYIVPLGLILGAFLLTKSRTWREFLGHATVGAVMFFIGGAPFWYANLLLEPRFATFKHLSGRSKFPYETLRNLKGFFTESLPILLGSNRFWTTESVFPGAAVIGYVVLGVSVMASLRLLLRRDMKGLGLLYLFLLITPCIFALSFFGYLTQAPRYLLPLYSVLFLFVSLGTELLPRILGSASYLAALALALCSNYLGGFSIPGQPFVAFGERVAADQTPLYRWLAEHGYSHIRTNYWIGYRAAFETGERVTFSQLGSPHSVRIGEYEDLGRDYRYEAPFVLVPSQEKALLMELEEIGGNYHREVLGTYVVIEPLWDGESFGKENEIPIVDLKGSNRPENLGRLVDRNRGTRWGSGGAQRKGMWIEGRFPEPYVVTGMKLDVGFWHADFSRGLVVELINERGESCSIFDGPTEFLHDLIGPKLRLESDSEQKMVGFRLIETGTDPVFDWSFAEIQAYGVKE